MVRLKNRYMLLDITTEDGKPDEGLNGKLLLASIKEALAALHGDYGAGACQQSLKVLYLHAPTQLAVLRCNRDYYEMAWSAVTTMSLVRKKPCMINCIKLSGSLDCIQTALREELNARIDTKLQLCTTPLERTKLEAARAQALEEIGDID